MKLSELSPQQKSRWIAEMLEPKPTCESDSRNDYCSCELPDWVDDDDGVDYYTSEGNLWIFAYLGGGQWKQCPRDFVDDPAMTVLLMEQMAQPRSYGFMFKAVMECIYGFDTARPDDPRLQRAVVDAFMLWKGWKENQEES